MVEPLLRVDNLVRRYGGITATDNLSMEVVPGELHAIIGPNGAGKTTLISQLTGQLMPNSGTIHFAGRDVTWLPSYQRSRLGLARSFQITCLLPDFTAADNVALAAQAHVASGGGATELLAVGGGGVLVLEEAVQIGGVRGIDADFECLQPVAGHVALEGKGVRAWRDEAVELRKGRRLAFAEIGPEDAALLHHGIGTLADTLAEF